MLNLLDKYYDESLKLNERFEITEKRPWDYLTVLNELSVQIGHIFTIDNDSETVEAYRNITNLGDEISDVFFQLMLLIKYLDYDIKKIEYNCNEYKLDSFMIAFGQVSEAILEKGGLRFNKPRPGFNNLEEYIYFKTSQLFSIIYNYSKEKNIDLDKEYSLMLDDANNFLDNFKKKNI